MCTLKQEYDLRTKQLYPSYFFCSVLHDFDDWCDKIYFGCRSQSLTLFVNIRKVMKNSVNLLYIRKGGGGGCKTDFLKAAKKKK